MDLFDNTTFTKEKDNSTRNKFTEGYVHIADRYVPPRAVAVLPEVLQIRHKSITPRRPLPGRVCFGPVEGITKTVSSSETKDLIKKSMESKQALFLLKNDENIVTHIDTTDQDKSNWISLLQLGDQMTANVWLYEEEHKLYGVTTKSIPSRVPLMLGYSSEYVKTHGFPSESPCLDIQEELSNPPSEWWCYECQRAMLSASLLQHHMDIEHKVEKTISNRRHKCQRCKRSFSRLFTLKRHMSQHCAKKDEEKFELTKTPEKIPENVESESNTSPLLEESRVPSEEILQNLTASLDFNSLFDTYRISSLDLSGSSKSDMNDSESQLSKDDNSLANFSDPFTSIPTSLEGSSCRSSSTVNEDHQPVLSNASSECVDSQKVNVQNKKQDHVSDTPKEIFSCECGRVFSNKDKLIRHVMDHSNCTKTVESSDIMYKCEDCQLIFKRRGMFVNHLWRVHKNNTTSIPLERRVRYYPCVACSKTYCTAAKRDRHVQKHHPGTGGREARAVESGRRTCAAAACTECPRQYATRAKLMQHVRAAHPHIAPSLKISASSQSKSKKSDCCT